MAKAFKQISLHHIGHVAVVAAILLVPAGYLMWPAPPQALLFTEDKQFLATSQKISYSQTIAPILERRCVVCHGCYDAPCQLKLSSREGLERGINKQMIYDSTRFKDMAPTRLFIDAKNIPGWRKKGFHPILNELNREQVPPGKSLATPEENLRQSLLYQLLRLKRDYPQPTTGRLPDDFDLALNRDQACPTREEFAAHAQEHPLWGMPYAMPGLADAEYRVLVQWIAQGAPAQASYPPVPSPQADMQIQQWETLLNGTSNKERLVSRYLYEHLFQAHIHFDNTDDREFYRLIRSSTPPGERANEIATVLPFSNPGDNPFYYRLIRFPASIVAKSHIVYVLSERKMKRIKALFFEPEYLVTQQPSYQLALATNPFKVFAAIPPSSRYRFLLDDARFFIESFIKGPVCRGQVALNSIEAVLGDVF